MLGGRSVGRLVFEEMQYGKDKLKTMAISLHRKLNEWQMITYDQNKAAADCSIGKVFFVSEYGGTAKTFL